MAKKASMKFIDFFLFDEDLSSGSLGLKEILT